MIDAKVRGGKWAFLGRGGGKPWSGWEREEEIWGTLTQGMTQPHCFDQGSSAAAHTPPVSERVESAIAKKSSSRGHPGTRLSELLIAFACVHVHMCS